MTAQELREIAGRNIKIIRKANGLSISELAKLLEITPSYMRLIENGERGGSQITMYKLSKLWDLSIDSLFDAEADLSQPIGKKYSHHMDPKLIKMLALMDGFIDKEREFVISMIKNLRDIKQAHSKADRMGNNRVESIIIF